MLAEVDDDDVDSMSLLSSAIAYHSFAYCVLCRRIGITLLGCQCHGRGRESRIGQGRILDLASTDDAWTLSTAEGMRKCREDESYDGRWAVAISRIRWVIGSDGSVVEVEVDLRVTDAMMDTTHIFEVRLF